MSLSYIGGIHTALGGILIYPDSDLLLHSEQALSYSCVRATIQISFRNLSIGTLMFQLKALVVHMIELLQTFSFMNPRP